MSVSKPFSLSPRKIFHQPGQSTNPPICKRNGKKQRLPSLRKFQPKISRLYRRKISQARELANTFHLPAETFSPFSARRKDASTISPNPFSIFPRHLKNRQTKARTGVTAIFLASRENSDRRFGAYLAEESKRRGPAVGRRDANVDASCGDEKNEKKKKKMQSSLVPPTLPLLTAEVGWPVVGSVHGD